MAITYNAPEVAKKDLVSETTNTVKRPTRMFRPLPHKAGEKATNELFMPLYQPDRWEIFNKSPEEAERLGLVNGNPIAPKQDGDDPIYTYHFKLPVHNIEKYQYSEGNTGFMSFICPNKFNEYLTSIWQKSPLFKSGSCPFCEAKKQAWSDHNDRWDTVLAEKGLTEKPKGKEYHNIVESDPILKETYDRATKTFDLAEKHVVDVVDYGKVTGRVPLDENEEHVQHQYWIAPHTVMKSLSAFYEKAARKGKAPFFVHNPEGLRIMEVDKDTTKCKKNNFRDTDYQVMEGDVVKVDEAWFNFMTNLEAMADPSEVINLLTVEEMNKYANAVDESANVPAKSMNEYMPKTTAPSTVQAPPVVAKKEALGPVASSAPAAPETRTAPPPTSSTRTAPPVAPSVPQMAPPVPGMDDAEDPFDGPDRGDSSDQVSSW